VAVKDKKPTTPAKAKETPEVILSKLLWDNGSDSFARMTILMAIKRTLTDRGGAIVKWSDIPGAARFKKDKTFNVAFNVNGRPYPFLEIMASMQKELKAAVLYEARTTTAMMIERFRTKIGQQNAKEIIKELDDADAHCGGFTDNDMDLLDEDNNGFVL